MTDTPPKLTISEYDKLMRRIWELEQKFSVMERATLQAVQLDKLFDEQRLIKKMLIKIGTRLFKDAIKGNKP